MPYYQDTINSLSTQLDVVSNRLANIGKGEQPKVFSQNELKDCDIKGGGPWYQAMQLKRGRDPIDIPTPKGWHDYYGAQSV